MEPPARNGEEPGALPRQGRIRPAVLSGAELERALDAFRSAGYGVKALKLGKPGAARGHPEPTLAALLSELVARRGQDLHLSAGAPPSLRVDAVPRRRAAPAPRPARRRAAAGVNQRLLRRASGEGRALAWESLTSSNRVRHALRDGRAHALRAMMQSNLDELHSIDKSLADLVIRGVVEREEAAKFADDLGYFEVLCGGARAE